MVNVPLIKVEDNAKTQMRLMKCVIINQTEFLNAHLSGVLFSPDNFKGRPKESGSVYYERQRQNSTLNLRNGSTVYVREL